MRYEGGKGGRKLTCSLCGCMRTSGEMRRCDKITDPDVATFRTCGAIICSLCRVSRINGTYDYCPDHAPAEIKPPETPL